MTEDWMVIVILVMSVLSVLINIVECFGNWASTIKTSTCCGGSFERVVVEGEHRDNDNKNEHDDNFGVKNYLDVINGVRQSQRYEEGNGKTEV